MRMGQQGFPELKNPAWLGVLSRFKSRRGCGRESFAMFFSARLEEGDVLVKVILVSSTRLFVMIFVITITTFVP